MDDIERYDFWHREMNEYLANFKKEKEAKEKEEKEANKKPMDDASTFKDDEI